MASAVVKALVAARQKCLTDDEAYWDPKPDFTRPISARNEAAALSWLLDHQAVVCRGGPADVAELRALCAAYCAAQGARAPPEQAGEAEAGRGAAAAVAPAAGAGTGAGAGVGGAEAPSTSGRSFEEASAEAALQRWCTDKGVKGPASPALFGAAPSPSSPSSPSSPPPLRGLRADAPVAPGDVVLAVPSELLISYEYAKESDLGKVLCALPLGLGDDSVALVWTCVERHEPEAAHAPFWGALPERFATVLSAAEEDLELLEGTPLVGEAARARQHIREAFDASAPAFASLLKAYPDYFKPEWFTWEAYVWAAELWYSYGIQVQFPGGDIRTCLAPYLGLMNHHPLPHVVHFSKVDSATGCLRVRAFRPCAPGRQLFLSYGPYPNGKLLLFYGFALEDNPADEVELVLQVPTGPSATDRRAMLTAASLTCEHRLRSSDRLAPALLAAARVLAAPPPHLKRLRALPPADLKARLHAAPGAVGKEEAEVDAAAMRLVAAAVGALLAPAEAAEVRLAEAAPQAADSPARKELRHFARVYANGVVRVLRAASGAVAAGLAAVEALA